MKAFFRSFLVMCLLWLIAQAVQHWPETAKVVQNTAAFPTVQVQPQSDHHSLNAKVRSMPVD